MREQLRKQNIIIVLMILLLLVTVGYATLSTLITINGTSKIINSTWNVYFDNLIVTDGSVLINTETYASAKAASIDETNKTKISYNVLLSLPGDFYEFTVDARNDGSIDAMIDTVKTIIKIDGIKITEENIPDWLNYTTTYTDGTSLEKNQLLGANSKETYKLRLEFVKDITNEQFESAVGKEITCDFEVEYVQRDANADTVRVTPVSFEDDDWDTVVAAAKSGKTSAYTVGSTKEVDLGTLGKHTLRVANNSTPDECSAEGFSQTACGFVLEFEDIITTHNMNPSGEYKGTNYSSGWNVDGWPVTKMREYLNDTIYNAIPETLRNAISDTKVISGHGKTSGEVNFTSTDKLYLFSAKEVGFDVSYDTANAETRNLDYYNANNNDSSRVKKYNNKDAIWWLRSARSTYDNGFITVNSNGTAGTAFAFRSYGLSPALRIVPNT